MTAIMDTLFYPFKSNVLPYPAAGQRAAFFNVQGCDDLKMFKAGTLYLQQHFKPFAEALEKRGHTVHAAFPEEKDGYDYVLICLPKNMVEARYMMACALDALRKGGALVAAADNKAGGGRIKKMLQGFGLETVQDYSKNKARVCWTEKDSLDERALQKALDEGEPQGILEDTFMSQPGVFGWNKIDQGSQILTEFLPEELSGKGADFGCGYGFLSAHILEHCAGIRTLYAIDADARAVEMCAANLQQKFPDKDAQSLWHDLTCFSDEAQPIADLDFIVMNPPFHEGKAADSMIGSAFISTAYKALGKSGRLYMVANAHLPYERDLAQFSSCTKLYEGKGFKVFSAAK